MKLITWNCQGAFRKKVDSILAHQPDILVIQECEHPDKLFLNLLSQKPNDYIWFGNSNHKGVGVFSFSDYRFQLLDQHDPNFKTILPVGVSGGPFLFTLFAIWAHNPQDKNSQYVEQIWKAIGHYDPLLRAGNSILTGDFNSNKIWDRKNRVGNHSDVVDRLAEQNIHSIYHKFSGEAQGEETKPTFYLQRNKNKPYHIDYCFASNELIASLQKLEVGSYDDWISHSDHSPLMVEFDF